MSESAKKRLQKNLLLVLLVLACSVVPSGEAQAAKRGWVRSGNTYYYYLKNGKKAKNRWVGDYYVTKTGARATNQWITSKEKRWFVGKTENTSPISGRLGQSGKTGTITPKVEKKTSTWITWKGQRYYVNEKGIRAVHWQKIQKKQYYFDKSGNLKTSSWLKKEAGIITSTAKGVCPPGADEHQQPGNSYQNPV